MCSWPPTKTTAYFKRPILLGGVQPKIVDLVDSAESRQKETLHSKVQRRFTPTWFIVSIMAEIAEAAENQHSQKELLLDFSFSNLILVTTRKSFETTWV